MVESPLAIEQHVPTRDSITLHLNILSEMSAAAITPQHLVVAIYGVDYVRSQERGSGGYFPDWPFSRAGDDVEVAATYSPSSINNSSQNAADCIIVDEDRMTGYEFSEDISTGEIEIHRWVLTDLQKRITASKLDSLSPHEAKRIATTLRDGFIKNDPRKPRK